jgi:hypothetical protein
MTCCPVSIDHRNGRNEARSVFLEAEKREIARIRGPVTSTRVSCDVYEPIERENGPDSRERGAREVAGTFACTSHKSPGEGRSPLSHLAFLLSPLRGPALSPFSPGDEVERPCKSGARAHLALWKRGS